MKNYKNIAIGRMYQLHKVDTKKQLSEGVTELSYITPANQSVDEKRVFRSDKMLYFRGMSR